MRMNHKWMKKCLCAYMAAMAACGGAWATDYTLTPSAAGAAATVSTTAGAEKAAPTNAAWNDSAALATGDTLTIATTSYDTALTIGGDGTTTLGNVTGGNSAADTLIVNGTATITVGDISGFSAVTLETATNTGTITATTVTTGAGEVTTGAINISGEMTVGGNVAATGDVSANKLTVNAGTLSAGTLGNTAEIDTLTIGADGNIDIAGATKAKNIIANNSVTMKNDLTVSGDLTVASGKTFTTAGMTSIAKATLGGATLSTAGTKTTIVDLAVSGTSTLNAGAETEVTSATVNSGTTLNAKNTAGPLTFATLNLDGGNFANNGGDITITTLAVSAKGGKLTQSGATTITATNLEGALTSAAALGGITVKGTKAALNGTATGAFLAFDAAGGTLTLKDATLGLTGALTGANGTIALNGATLTAGSASGDLANLNVAGTNTVNVTDGLTATNLNVNGNTTLNSTEGLNATATDIKSNLTLNISQDVTLGAVTLNADKCSLVNTQSDKTVSFSNLNYTTNVNEFTLGSAQNNSGKYELTTATEIASGKTLNVYGTLSATNAVTNNGDIYLMGDNSGFANLTTNGSTGNLNIIGNEVTLAGLTGNDGTIDISGANAVLSGLATNTGTININASGAQLSALTSNAGTLYIGGTGSVTTGLTTGNFGKITISLSGRTPHTVTEPQAAALTVSSLDASDVRKISFIDARNRGVTYSVLKGGTGGDAGVIAALTGISNAKYNYTGGWDGTNGVYTVFAHKQDTTHLAEVAKKGSDLNGGISDALERMIENDSLANEIADAIGDFTKTANQAQAARAVTELNGSNAASASSRVGSNAAQQFNAAVGNVFAEAHTGRVLAKMNSGNVHLSKVERAAAGGMPHQHYTRTPKLSNNLEVKRWNGWVKGYGNWGTEDGNASTAGYDFNGGGFMLGMDYLLAEELNIGALFGYSYNKADMNKNLGKVTDNILRMGVYGAYNWENFFFNSTPTFGIHMIESQRNINVMNTVAKGERTGFDFNWYNQLGYTFCFGNNWMITPSYSIAWTVMHDADYRESGAGVANLRVDDCNQFSLLQNLGFKIGKAFQVNENLTLLPEIWGSWEHEYLDTNEVSMGFANVSSTKWNAPVAKIADDRGVFGAGVKVLMKDRFEFYGRYDQRIWDGGFDGSVTVGFGVKF